MVAAQPSETAVSSPRADPSGPTASANSARKG